MTSDFLHTYPHSLELTLSFAAKATSQEQEALWDELVAWLENRHAFIGGSPACAFVLVTGTDQPLDLDLQQWLKEQRRIQQFLLLPARSREFTATPGLRHNALVEALFHLQQHLVEQMGMAAQALFFLKTDTTQAID